MEYQRPASTIKCQTVTKQISITHMIKCYLDNDLIIYLTPFTLLWLFFWNSLRIKIYIELLTTKGPKSWNSHLCHSFVFVVSMMHRHWTSKDFLPVRVISFETLSMASTASAPSSQASMKNFSGVVCLGENERSNHTLQMFNQVQQISAPKQRSTASGSSKDSNWLLCNKKFDKLFM